MSPSSVADGGSVWAPWHESFAQPLRRLVDVWNDNPGASSFASYRATTADLQLLIAESLQRPEGIRGLGGGWSWSKVVACGGTLVNTKPLNYRFPFTSAVVHPDCPIEPGNLFLAQCGCSIAELNRYLFEKGKSLKTSGASNGQTIAGAASTGTHGAAIDVGAIPDFVRAIHLVTGPDRHVWIERESRPTAADHLAAHLEAELIRDDAVFESAVVSFGSFGIVQGLVIEVEDLFWLTHHRRRLPLDGALLGTLGSLEFNGVALPQSGRPHHLQVIVNPFDLDDGAVVDVMYKSARPVPGLELPGGLGSFTQGDDAAAVLAFLSDTFSAVGVALGQGLATFGLKDIDPPVCGTHAQMFSDTALRGRTASCALGIPLASVGTALAHLLALHAQDRVPVLFAMRFVRSTGATLGFTRHGDRTCVLEIDGVGSQRVLRFIDRALFALATEGVPFTLHWGKMNSFWNSESVRQAYGEASIEAWLAARGELLPTADLRAVFANDYLRRLELDGPHA